jgi:hypothetical protein
MEQQVATSCKLVKVCPAIDSPHVVTFESVVESILLLLHHHYLRSRTLEEFLTMIKRTVEQLERNEPEVERK